VGVISTFHGLSHLNKSQLPCDMAEVRLDYLMKAQAPLEKVLARIEKRKCPVLITLRSPREGGQADLFESERRSILFAFLGMADAVDIEWADRIAMKPILKEAKKIKLPVILSTHDFEQCPKPAALKKRLVSMKAAKTSGIIKMAVRCDTVDELARLLAFQLENKKENLALMGMGKCARESRQLLPLLGSRLVYGWLDAPTAPGQPKVSELR